MIPAPVSPKPFSPAVLAAGWPVPWWSLLLGGGFVALMASPVGELVGFFLIWMIIFTLAPFMIIGSMIGGSTGGYVVAGLLLTTFVVAPPVMTALAIARTPSQLAKALMLNQLVLFLAFCAGVAVSIRTFADAWPY
jgi:hypothetical protein